MLTGFIDDLRSNKWFAGIESIRKIMDFIQNTDFSKIDDGSYNTGDGDLNYIVTTYSTTASAEERPAEVHKKKIDFQYIIYGEEKVGYADIRNAKRPAGEYDDKKDTEFFTRVDNEGYFILKKGMYAVFFPEDIHRPGINNGETRGIRKVIFKVRI